MSYLAYKFRIYPSKEQELQLQAHCDAARFVYNKLLEMNIEQYEKEKKFTFGLGLTKISTQLRQSNGFLKDVNSQSLMQSALNLGIAFKNRFKHKSGFPKFKSRRDSKQAFSVPQHFSIDSNLIKLPKIGWIKVNQHRKLRGKAKSITISKDVDQWYASILCDIGVQEAPQIDHENVVGIDFGIKTFAITSDGEVFNLPDQSKREKRLKLLQRRHSKKLKGSKNREKARIKVAKKYRQIRRTKENSINNFISAITKRYDVVVLENLNIKGMKKNRKLSGTIQKLPWYSMKSKLQQKAKLIQEADRWFPSSKTCSCCGWVNRDLKLSQRIFECDQCVLSIDRDLNAALNLKKLYVTDATSGSACGGPACGAVAPVTASYGPLKQECGSSGIQAVKSLD